MPLLRRHLLALGLCAAAALPAAAQSSRFELQWFGQSAFKLTTPSGKVVMIDPWITANPRTPAEHKDLAKLGKVDLVLVTHAHGDHLGDAPAIALANKARMFAPGDMNSTVGALGILPAELIPRMNKSGTVTPFADQPDFKITEVKAEHSSVLMWKNPATGKDEAHYGGEPVGFIITLENGYRIWHMGDTGLFGDMQFIARYYNPDLVLIPIGGNFTMDPKDAAYALKEWIRPKAALPMHYGANPLAKGTLAEFTEAMKDSSVFVHKLTEGGRMVIERREMRSMDTSVKSGG